MWTGAYIFWIRRIKLKWNIYRRKYDIENKNDFCWMAEMRNYTKNLFHYCSCDMNLKEGNSILTTVGFFVNMVQVVILASTHTYKYVWIWSTLVWVVQLLHTRMLLRRQFFLFGSSDGRKKLLQMRFLFKLLVVCI